jgi:ferritin-like metal-binding protein YciE
MVSDEMGARLHDRATRGHTLTAEERQLLEQWYQQLDRAEAAALNIAIDENLPEEHKLQEQIDAVLARIGSVSEQIQKLTEEKNL